LLVCDIKSELISFEPKAINMFLTKNSFRRGMGLFFILSASLFSETDAAFEQREEAEYLGKFRVDERCSGIISIRELLLLPFYPAQLV
jgi:hypothetical protein